MKIPPLAQLILAAVGVSGMGMRAWNDGKLSAFLCEWVVFPLIIVGVSATVFFVSRHLRK